MNEQKNMSIVFSSGISDIVEHNSSFDRGVLRVCYTGKNRNGSYISKEVFEKCMPSIYNCPIVCRYDRENDEIGGHDIDIVSDDRGIRIVNATHPVGAIPESARFWFETIEDDSGEHEYLCVDALLWKRQEAYRKIKTDGITEESMEITIKDGSMVDGVYVINQFEFAAFCLLGTVSPCYESASLEMFSCNDFNQELTKMMYEFKEAVATGQVPIDEQQSIDVASYTKKNNSEGGKEALEEKIEILESFGLSAEQLNCNLEEIDVAELREQCEQFAESQKEEPKEEKQDFALEDQFRSELWEAVSEETIDTCFGEMSRYWFVDYDREAMEVYCHDCEDHRLYGFGYSVNGDNVVVDFESKKRKKFSIVDFDNGEQDPVFASVFGEIEKKFNEQTANSAQMCQEASDKMSAMEVELTSLREFKLEAENAEAENARAEVFAQFEDLENTEAFEALKQNCSELTAEALEEKCYAIRGRLGAPAKFSLNTNKSTKLPIESGIAGKADEPYGGIFAEYGISAKTNI